MTITPWLTKVGPYTVEKIVCPYFNEFVNLNAPGAGILHTTEGPTIAGAMSVFTEHWAPHFLVGPDENDVIHIIQMVPIGNIGAACVTNNDLAIIQIEMCAFSQETLWKPYIGTLSYVSALMRVCYDEYGIPLTRCWADGDYGLYGPNPHRTSGKFGTVAGWFGHGDIPSPDVHWDPGCLEWSALFGMAWTR